MIQKERLQTIAEQAHRKIDGDLITMLFHFAKKNGLHTTGALATWMRERLIPDTAAMVDVLADWVEREEDEQSVIDAVNDAMQVAEDCACEGGPMIRHTGLSASEAIDISEISAFLAGPLQPNDPLPPAPSYVHAYLAAKVTIENACTPAVAIFPYHSDQEREDAYAQAVAMRLFDTIEMHDHPPKIEPLLLRFTERLG